MTLSLGARRLYCLFSEIVLVVGSVTVLGERQV